jgi:hypothetical protein
MNQISPDVFTQLETTHHIPDAGTTNAKPTVSERYNLRSPFWDKMGIGSCPLSVAI